MYIIIHTNKEMVTILRPPCKVKPLFIILFLQIAFILPYFVKELFPEIKADPPGEERQDKDKEVVFPDAV